MQLVQVFLISATLYFFPQGLSIDEYKSLFCYHKYFDPPTPTLVDPPSIPSWLEYGMAVTFLKPCQIFLRA